MSKKSLCPKKRFTKDDLLELEDEEGSEPLFHYLAPYSFNTILLDLVFEYMLKHKGKLPPVKLWSKLKGKVNLIMIDEVCRMKYQNQTLLYS